MGKPPTLQVSGGGRHKEQQCVKEARFKEQLVSPVSYARYELIYLKLLC
jgi:hypothetical protein